MSSGGEVVAKSLWQSLGVKSVDSKSEGDCLSLLICYMCILTTQLQSVFFEGRKWH